MYIQLTKKLSDEMKIKVEKPDLSNENQLFCWYANIFKIGRKKCVIVMNNVTRYCFIIYGLLKKDFTNFEELIRENIVGNFLGNEFDIEKIDSYMEQLGDAQYTATSDRSIISQMNDMIYQAEHIIHYLAEEGETISLLQLNLDLNETPLVKLNSYPYKLMRDALDESFIK
ncbi:hypothetical protein [Bacillus sp. AFS029533]|uniref:DUF6933 domain-containing protein n=1 Tax=Bacillus sp. AFS029533 TaxID=2033494 RepID=UPI000BFC3319|nr:hypothetical protein [Bacillus sp. AFS029533]PGZ92153.1 hypothetical protein COE53_12365 [Bacillus sp. AFS029533]